MVQEGESREEADLAGQAATESRVVRDSPEQSSSGQYKRRANERTQSASCGYIALDA
jgi:hypothetical protein